MPAFFERRSDEQKTEYLKALVPRVYLSDIVERSNVQYPEEMDSPVDFLRSSVGSLANPKNFRYIKNPDGKICRRCHG